MQNSRRVRLRHFSPLLVLVLLAFWPPPAPAQILEKPLINIDEDITAFSLGPDGRIAYAVNRGFKTKRYDLEHDDIWIQDPGGKRRRILIGEKFLRGNTPFTYEAHSFRWSPNGRRILAELFVASIDETGKTQDSSETIVLEENGKEVKGGGNERVIDNSYDPLWLQDNSTIVYLTEVLKPRILFSFRYLSLTGGPGGPVFEGRTFLDAVRVPGGNVAIAVEHDRNLTGPPRLQRLDLLAQDDRELATLDGYEGGLSLSPNGDKIAYYIDKEVLEIRSLTDLTQTARLRIGLGIFHWAPDETRIFLKRSVEKKSGDVVWFDVPPLAAPSPTANQPPPVIQPTPISIFRGLTFRDFAIFPDARIAVIAVGKRNLSVYPLPGR
jgi:dipeptidyl aminopeptidase/acylaminoacyl peptidase